MPHVNFLAVLVSGVAIFILGALWASLSSSRRPGLD
jgi:hypothetical protein